MKSLTARTLKIGTKTRTRFPRTNVLKREGRLTRVPNRPNNLKFMLLTPLSAFVGQFKRRRREIYTKPARAEYIREALLAQDKGLATELGL